MAIRPPDTCNMSPLYAAADKGRTSAIEALLELGADANVETEQAERCDEYQRWQNYFSIVDIAIGSSC